MQHPHFIPQIGQVLTTLSAENANYRLIASADETAVYYRRVTEHQVVYVVTEGTPRLIMTITSSLQVATYASTLSTRRKP